MAGVEALRPRPPERIISVLFPGSSGSSGTPKTLDRLLRHVWRCVEPSGFGNSGTAGRMASRWRSAEPFRRGVVGVAWVWLGIGRNG